MIAPAAPGDAARVLAEMRDCATARAGADLAAGLDSTRDERPLATIRLARTTLIGVARETDDAAIAAAVQAYARALTAASFAPYTVRALISAALDVAREMDHDTAPPTDDAGARDRAAANRHRRPEGRVRHRRTSPSSPFR